MICQENRQSHLIDQDLYYVDRTLLVRDVLEKGGRMTLLTRPGDTK